MIAKDDKVRALIAEQAGEWFVANDAGPLDARKSAALVDWFRTSPMHVEEFLAVAAIARDLRELGTDPEYSVENLLARAHAEDDRSVQPFWSRGSAAVWAFPLRRWQAAAVAMAALAVVGALWFWSLMPTAPVSAPVEARALHFETRHGEQQTHRLADNSVLHLNTDTAVTIHYSKTERLIVLRFGEADFEVAHEPKRAFRVLAGPAEVVDLGTQFDVRLGDSAVVTVAEGHVAVGLSPVGSDRRPTSRFIALGANQQMTVAPGTWPATPMTVDAQRTTSWLHRQINFDRVPLGRVAAEFNRYAPKPVEITTARLRDLEISGVFSTDDTEEFIAFLRSLEGVRVEITATRILVSQK
jgi:transmembrane sensor